MQYVYILRSRKDNKMYTGCTKDLKKRVIMHNKGLVESTRDRVPLGLIYYEAFRNQEDAFNREKYLKTGWGRNQIKQILKVELNLGG